MKTFFQSQDLWEIVQDGFGTSKEENKKSSKALFFLQQALENRMFSRIMGATSAKQAWDILKEEFHGSEKEIVNQMRAYGGTISDKKVVEKILVSVTGKYDPIIIAIEESKDITKLSVTELMGSLEAYENRLSQRNEDSVESAFNNHMIGDANIFCDIDTSNKSQVRLGNGALVEVKGKGKRKRYDCRRDQEGKKIHKKCSPSLGNGALVEVKGKGTIAVETKKGRRFIKNVLLVPNLQQNLLIVGQMIQNGYSIHFEGDSYTIFDSNNKSTVIARVKMENQNFPIRWSYATEAAMKAGSVDDMKSTLGYTFSLGSGIFSWTSKKQDSVAQSSAEAEYVTSATTTSQVIWLRRIFKDMGEKYNQATKILCDSAMAKNPVFHGQTKHITIKYHFLREAEANKDIELEYCRTEEQLADIFTKALPKVRFELLRSLIGVTKMCIKEEC
ncbi:hypothetical protein EZV62_017616 [Acer yangbiense]|uniref:Retrovirus-related Pol polyprotein from transposon TNT 1-94-like beta-barrel domain-containing protein n=1 Tax=Acer yangbiense TaxID=1000413 RepID=A0A5C7HGW2_9ROSI|nr:hypothetical protein EZV62_017616 [Acer yangbiense]